MAGHHSRPEASPLSQTAFYEPESGVMTNRNVYITMTRAQFGEMNPNTSIQEKLHDSIIGQEEAIESVVSALNRERLRNPDRPLANLLFLGPTGVGKSQTAKELARLLQNEGKQSFLKIDCSTFSQGHTVSALLGSPPGYVGREQTPLLDPAIIEQPRSVVLFDEIEKGSQPLWDLLLQIMEDGEISLLGEAKKVSFRNSIIIVTSNVGSAQIAQLLDTKTFGFYTDHAAGAPTTKKQIDAAALAALKERFRPELINRFDKRIVFGNLDDSHLVDILGRYISDANQRYNRQGYQLDISDSLAHNLINNAEDRSQFGARPVLRAFDSRVEGLFADLIISGGIPPSSRVYAILQSELPDAERTGNPDDVVFYYQRFPQPSQAIAQLPAVHDTSVAEPLASTAEG
jgi:ATP-dependent Clp protease ATP-binding subunit ClpA